VLGRVEGALVAVDIGNEGPARHLPGSHDVE
jgi:hypothetical protein